MSRRLDFFGAKFQELDRSAALCEKEQPKKSEKKNLRGTGRFRVSAGFEFALLDVVMLLERELDLSTFRRVKPEPVDPLFLTRR